jgi:hypothetical protein
MREFQQDFKANDDESEATLVTPRFDAEEARRAHPVVPLEEARAPYAEARRRRGPRRSWPTAIAAVALFAVVAAGAALATRVLRRTQPAPPAQAVVSPAPEPAAEAPQRHQTEPAQQPAPREEARAKQTSRAPRLARERGDEREAAPAPPATLAVAGDAEESDDKGDERRGRGGAKERRRGREQDEAEKEMRKALKHAKSKVPRLVDVLTGP